MNYPENHLKNQVDIIIVGGSLTGQLICSVLKDKFNLLLIDIKLPSEEKTTKGGRTLAISKASIDYLCEMGFSPNSQQLLNAFDNNKGLFSKINELNISQYKQRFSLNLKAYEHQLDYLGVCVGVNQLLNILLEKNATFLKQNWIQSSVESYLPSQDKVEIFLKNGEKLEAKLVIFASGNQFIPKAKKSEFAFDIEQEKSHCSTLVGSVHLDLAEKAYQRYCNSGVYALLPIGKDKAAWIYSFDDEQKQSFEPIFKKGSTTELSKTAQKKIYQKYVEIYPKLFASVDKKEIEFGGLWPIHKVYSKKVYQNRTLLLGAGALSFSPIAAQGFNLTIKDVYQLFKCLEENTIEIEKCVSFAFEVEKHHQKIQWLMNSLEAIAYQRESHKQFIASAILKNTLFMLNIPWVQKQFLQFFTQSHLQ